MSAAPGTSRMSPARGGVTRLPMTGPVPVAGPLSATPEVVASPEPLSAIGDVEILAVAVRPAAPDSEGVRLGPGAGDLAAAHRVDLVGIAEDQRLTGRVGETAVHPLTGPRPPAGAAGGRRRDPWRPPQCRCRTRAARPRAHRGGHQRPGRGRRRRRRRVRAGVRRGAAAGLVHADLAHRGPGETSGRPGRAVRCRRPRRGDPAGRRRRPGRVRRPRGRHLAVPRQVTAVARRPGHRPRRRRRGSRSGSGTRRRWPPTASRPSSAWVAARPGRRG